MKKILFIFLFITALFLSSCENPDFARYESYEVDTSKYLDGSAFIISEIEEEMYNIAAKYCKDIRLTEVEYNLVSEVTGTSHFYYSKVDDEKTTIVILELDISKNEVTKVIYEKGHSKRVSYSGSYVENTNYNVNDIYEDIINHLNAKTYITELSNMKITFVNNKIMVNCYEKFNKVPYGYNYPLLPE